MADTGIAVAQLAFFAACKAVKAYRSAVSYFDDAAELTVKLEIERWRLQTWGTNSGLAEGKLAPLLAERSDILLFQLEAISRIFGNADKVRERYGVQAGIKDGAVEPNVVSTLMAAMGKSIRSSGIKSHGSESPEESEQDGEDIPEMTTASRAMSKRARWVMKDGDQLKKLITDLRKEINTLDKLLSETQRRGLANDHERIKVIVVGRAVDDESLALVRAVVDSDGDVDTLAKLDRRALSNEAGSSARPMAPLAMRTLFLMHYDIPADFATRNRFLAPRRDSPAILYLFERKAFEPDLDGKSKGILRGRVQALVSLLGLKKTSDFKVPRAAGFIHDPDRFCWWLVLEFPLASPPAASPVSHLQTSSEPLSLFRMLQPDVKPRPPLEKRFQLARDVAATFYQLYGSNWMHKSIRSDNILFPYTDSHTRLVGNELASPIVCGFEYSRLATETQSIDSAKTSTDISVAMYRHPDYQGEAAQGYQIPYDIYSVGLILLEIGLWAPLTSLFDPKPTKTPGSSSSRPLWKGTEHFHALEAQILRARVVETIRRDLPFRMGSTYATLTRWCIEYSSQVLPESPDEPADHAVNFFNSVVEPLSSLGVGYC